MSHKYDEYLEEHISNVKKARAWIFDRLPDIEQKMMNDFTADYEFIAHDKSKFDKEEYDAYDAYFYNGANRSHKVVNDFNYAWLHHIHNNPHHWQYWVLQHDDEPEEVLEMPFKYVIEMICDWWSFSLKNRNPYEIFDWYEAHKNMKLHENTRKLVEEILNRIKGELDNEQIQ